MLLRSLLCNVVARFSSDAQVDSTGIKLIEQHKYAEAKSFFEAAVKANSKDAESHYQLARVFFMIAIRMKQKTKSMKHWN